jgi:thioredoxin 1
MKDGKKSKDVREVTDKDEIKTLMKSEKPVAIFYYAEWCPHCKVMKEPWKELSEEKGEEAEFVKMESENIPSDLGITGYPHFVYVKGGKVQSETGGEMPKEELKQKLFGGALSGGRRRRSRTRRNRRRVRKVAHRTLRNHMAFA